MTLRVRHAQEMGDPPEPRCIGLGSFRYNVRRCPAPPPLSPILRYVGDGDMPIPHAVAPICLDRRYTLLESRASECGTSARAGPEEIASRIASAAHLAGTGPPVPEAQLPLARGCARRLLPPPAEVARAHACAIAPGLYSYIPPRPPPTGARQAPMNCTCRAGSEWHEHLDRSGQPAKLRPSFARGKGDPSFRSGCCATEADIKKRSDWRSPNSSGAFHQKDATWMPGGCARSARRRELSDGNRTR